MLEPVIALYNRLTTSTTAKNTPTQPANRRPILRTPLNMVLIDKNAWLTLLPVVAIAPKPSAVFIIEPRDLSKMPNAEPKPTNPFLTLVAAFPKADRPIVLPPILEPTAAIALCIALNPPVATKA